MNTPSSEDQERQADADDGAGPADRETSRDARRSVSLPDRLVSRVEERLAYTTYDTPDEYVAFVLEETLARVEAESDDEPADVDADEVHDRLESLGYLDS